MLAIWPMGASRIYVHLGVRKNAVMHTLQQLALIHVARSGRRREMLRTASVTCAQLSLMSISVQVLRPEGVIAVTVKIINT
jgi:hypothetical protein